MLPLPCLPRLPHHTPSCCALLCWCHAPLNAPYVRRLSVPMPARPARPLSPAMCVLCNVLSLRWLVCSFGCDRVSSRLLVGCFQLLLFPVAMRLFLRVATRCPAVNAHSPGCRVVALVVCCAMRSVCKGRLAGSRLLSLCFGQSCSRLPYTTIHHTFFHVCPPYTTHTLIHTHRLHLSTPLAPHTPCTSLTPH